MEADKPITPRAERAAISKAKAVAALKETVLNVERFVEDGERVLRRARERLAEFERE